jgi:hypothetical protein
MAGECQAYGGERRTALAQRLSTVRLSGFERGGHWSCSTRACQATIQKVRIVSKKCGHLRRSSWVGLEAWCSKLD